MVTQVIACSAISHMLRHGPSPVAAADALHGSGGSGSGGVPDGSSTPVTWSCALPVFCARSACCTGNRCSQST
eukprot:1399745-Heterocapsa_arctica.AAC.1